MTPLEKLDSFVPNTRFFYPLKTSEKRKVSDVFRGQRKGALRTNGLIHTKKLHRYLQMVSSGQSSGKIDFNVATVKRIVIFSQIVQASSRKCTHKTKTAV